MRRIGHGGAWGIAFEGKRGRACASYAGRERGKPCDHAAVLAAAPVKDMAALYFTVRNTGPGTDHLDRVEVAGLSSDATMHTVRNHTMVRVRGYRVPPHGTLVLRRGGNHVMLRDLKQMPKAGGSVLARLFFRHTGEIDVDIPVVSQTYVPSSP